MPSARYGCIFNIETLAIFTFPGEVPAHAVSITGGTIEDINTGEVFQYLVVFLLATWTARLAITKGRNPWGWGGAALVLGLLPWHLFGVLPVLILLFVKLPTDAPADQAERLACARCAKTHSEGQHFCTGCGWDLNEPYSPEETDEIQPSPSRARATVPSTGVAQPPEAPEAPEAADEPIADASQKPVGESLQNDEGTPEAAETEHVPWGTYDSGMAPTAAFMVSRGNERFDAGKYQEAIDQFTKAIALDPDYADAWQRRAEAYIQLGRPKQAEEDRRHLQGLDPSSSPG